MDGGRRGGQGSLTPGQPFIRAVAKSTLLYCRIALYIGCRSTCILLLHIYCDSFIKCCHQHFTKFKVENVDLIESVCCNKNVTKDK